jgi:hypothetical protein
VFAGGDRTYTCHVENLHAFGREQQQKEARARMQALGLSLQATNLVEYIQFIAHLSGEEYTIIISATENGDIVRLLERQPDLAQIKSVASAAAAVDFLSLKRVLDYYDDKTLCSAGLVTSPGGWTITFLPRNCSAKLRDVKVTRSGEVAIAGERNAREVSCTVD